MRSWNLQESQAWGGLQKASLGPFSNKPCHSPWNHRWKPNVAGGWPKKTFYPWVRGRKPSWVWIMTDFLLPKDRKNDWQKSPLPRPGRPRLPAWDWVCTKTSEKALWHPPRPAEAMWETQQSPMGQASTWSTVRMKSSELRMKQTSRKVLWQSRPFPLVKLEELKLVVPGKQQEIPNSAQLPARLTQPSTAKQKGVVASQAWKFTQYCPHTLCHFQPKHVREIKKRRERKGGGWGKEESRGSGEVKK